jgi:SET domain-containing protein
MQKEIAELKEKVTQLQDERNEEQGTRKRKSDESATPVAIGREWRSIAREQDLKIARSKFNELDLWATDMRGRSQPSLTSRKGVMIRQSLIQGNGLFATSGFKKGDRILEYEGEVINKMEKTRREEIYDKTIFGTYIFAIEDKFIDATLTHTLARFINHSDDPNAYAGEQPPP